MRRQLQQHAGARYTFPTPASSVTNAILSQNAYSTHCSTIVIVASRGLLACNRKAFVFTVTPSETGAADSELLGLAAAEYF